MDMQTPSTPAVVGLWLLIVANDDVHGGKYIKYSQTSVTF